LAERSAVVGARVSPGLEGEIVPNLRGRG
jgi:hypothetical protein